MSENLRQAAPIVPGGPPPDATRWQGGTDVPTALDAAFDRDRFLLRQRALSVNAKYEVWDESGRPILFVERPAFVLRNLGAALTGLAAAAAVAFVFFGTAVKLSGHAPDAVTFILFALGAVLTIATLVVVATLLSPKRHVTFYRDDSKRERLLEVEQDHKLFLVRHTYTVRDPNGTVLGVLGKNVFTDILRKRWTCDSPGGQRLCVARENLVHAIVSRLLGKLFPMNFEFHLHPGDQLAGQFNRKFTLLDRYVLDLSADGSRRLDRRLALALGVMLDTGERR